MWMEEQNQDRVNVKRTLQLIDTGAQTIASACPFCMTMLTDGIKSKNVEDRIQQLDVAELLERSCDEPAAASDSPPPESRTPEPPHEPQVEPTEGPGVAPTEGTRVD
jgi:hypothetical protein